MPDTPSSATPTPTPGKSLKDAADELESIIESVEAIKGKEFSAQLRLSFNGLNVHRAIKSFLPADHPLIPLLVTFINDSICSVVVKENEEEILTWMDVMMRKLQEITYVAD